MKKAKKLENQYTPEITLEQILNYDSARVETHTSSKLMNAVLDVVTAPGGMVNPQVARRIGVDITLLSATVQVLTGMSLSLICKHLIAHRWRKYVEENPYFTPAELAAHLGFGGSGAMHHFLERNHRLFPDLILHESDEQKRLDRLAADVMRGETEEMRAFFLNLPFRGSAEEREDCFDLLYTHASYVRDIALEIAGRHPELNLYPSYLSTYALLHNVGVVLTYDPGIYCFGTEPYSRHAELGAEYIRRHFEDPLADSVALCHTLDNPSGPAVAASVYSDLVAYVAALCPIHDPGPRLSPQQARAALAAQSAEKAARFDRLHEMFG